MTNNDKRWEARIDDLISRRKPDPKVEYGFGWDSYFINPLMIKLFISQVEKEGYERGRDSIVRQTTVRDWDKLAKQFPKFVFEDEFQAFRDDLKKRIEGLTEDMSPGDSKYSEGYCFAVKDVLEVLETDG